MKVGRLGLVVVLLFVVTINPSHQQSVLNTNSDDILQQTSTDLVFPDSLKNRENSFSLSDTSSEGILNPLTIEQVGYTPSGTILARTDTDFNTAYSMYLDDTHNWFGSQVDVNVRDLSRLYVLNGTFSEGTESGTTISPSGFPDFYPYGWGATSVSGWDADVQQVRYEDTGREYIVVKNEAALINNPQHLYAHSSGVNIYWNQSIDIETTTSDYLLSFDYYYASGPIDGTGPDTPEDAVFIDVIVDGALVYNISLVNLLARETWYSTGQIPISLSTSLNPVNFQIGIGIRDYMTLDADYDYDYTPGADGPAQVDFTVYFDDVSLVAANAPEFEQIDLQFMVEGSGVPITGSNGVGSASVSKTDYWTVDPVNIQFTSNTTVSFEYDAYLQSHRFSNSTWKTSITDEGAHYSINLDENAQIHFNTYIGFLGDYVNLTTKAWFPSDWENVTVRDTFLDDVTSSCTVNGNMVEIPTSLMTQLGWWTFTLDSPNYIQTIEMQKHNPLLDTWAADSIYRSGNQSRAAIEIGTVSEIPDAIDLVNVTWMLPNGTTWAVDSVSGGLNGFLNSTPHVLGTANTSAGLWSICVSWINGTEVAFGSATFELHHATNLVAHKTLIETESGQVVTNFVYYTDAENGEFLMDPVASVSANWSVSTEIFGPDIVYNRWTGTFDTSEVGPGENLVLVTANQPYYDEATCTFIIYSTFADNELTIDNTPPEVGLWDTFSVTFQYLDRYGVGISGADVNISFTGTAGGLSWDSPANIVNGNYSVDFTAEHSGSYTITISASKNLYEASEDSFFLYVGAKSSTLSLENGSAAIISYGDQFRLVLRYVNGTGNGLDAATVTVESVIPSTGLDHSSATSLGDGYFAIDLTPQETNTFTLLISASLQDHKDGLESFTLTATSIQSRLSAVVSDEVIATDQTLVVTLNLTSLLYGPLDGAIVSPYNPPSGLSFSVATPLGGGLYNITIIPTETGSYQIVFIAYAANHNEATILVSIEVTPVPTNLRVAGGLSSASVEYSSGFDLLVFFERQDSPVNISSAHIEITFTSFETLVWENLSLAEGYLIRFTTDQVGRWEFTVTASKLGHQTEDIQFILFITEVGTDLTGFSPSEDLAFGFEYTFTFHYYLLGNTSAGIEGATVIVTGSGSDWLAIDDLGAGFYNVTLTPGGLGHRVVDLSFRKIGHQTRFLPLDFTVSETEIEVQMQPLIWHQLQDLTIVINLVETDTGNSVTDAIVSFQLVHNQLIELEGLLVETEVPGEYTSSVRPSWYDGSGYSLRIFVEKENFALVGGSHEASVAQYVDPDAAVALFLATVLPPIGGLIVLSIAALIGQTVRSRRKKAQYAIDLENKSRFNDVDNIIGVIVLHRMSGIPVYSRIIKGGFEEGIVAAFITAVSHFREEFDITEDDSMKVIPISDIIRAVHTKNLICAFVTVRSASISHNRKIESFAMQAGMYLDDIYSEMTPSIMLDSKVTDMLDFMFDTTMDGHLVKFHKTATSEKLPKQYRSIQQVLDEMETVHCSKPIFISKAMAKFGISEARACTLLNEAIEKELLIQCDEHEKPLTDFDLAKFFDEKGFGKSE